MEHDLYWYWLCNLSGVGRKTIRRLIDAFHTPEAVFLAEEREVIPFLRGAQTVKVFAASRKKELIKKQYEKIQRAGVTFLHPDSEQYPARLKNIPDPPIGLYLKGNMPDEGKKAIAVIGARDCTRYGEEMARFFGRELADCGISVISGLARGIDGMAHVGALEANGYTLGILGCGIDQVYPQENYNLFLKMQQTGGILSESNIGIKPSAGLFPERNRLIAGCADGVLVIEATDKSGTFITVDQALDQGKDIFALPGRITDKESEGCNRLIKMGAHMVTDVEDILEIFDLCSKTKRKCGVSEEIQDKIDHLSLAPFEKMVYSCLRIEPRYLEEIISEVRVAPQEVCMALNKLLVKGVIVETTRNYYAIKL